MGRKTFISLLVMVLCLGWGFSMTAMAQDTAKIFLREGPHRLLDTDFIKSQMQIARDMAGDDHYYLRMQRLQCRDIDENGTIDQSPGSNETTGCPDKPSSMNPTCWKEVSAVPTKVFDNVYYVGGMEIGGWVIDTGDGYIMLDAGYDYSYEEFLINNMKKLGLDPAKIKYILVTHAGPDHVGAVPKFQRDYPNIKVIYNADITRPAGIVTTLMKDGDTLTLGDTTITMVSTPRRVGGDGFSYLIPVKIKGKRHMWATFGNTNAAGGTIDDKFRYRESMAKFITYVKNLGADIAISSHPFVDASLDRMAIIRECNERGHKWWGSWQCAHNPFLIGKKAAVRYFEIMDWCSEVQRNRQEAGIDPTGLNYLPPPPPPTP
jgi:metallo-beta-lactamase class B